SGSGFSLLDAGLTMTLMINTTGSAVTTINSQTVNLPAHLPGGSGGYFVVKLSAPMKVAGFVNIIGPFTLSVDTGRVLISVNASVGIFGVAFSINGGIGIYSNGIAINATLTLGGSSGLMSVLGGVINISGTFNLQFNNTGSTKNINGVNVSGGTLFQV